MARRVKLRGAARMKELGRCLVFAWFTKDELEAIDRAKEKWLPRSQFVRSAVRKAVMSILDKAKAIDKPRGRKYKDRATGRVQRSA